MAQLTIEVPDALLPELEQLQTQLPLLLSQWAIARKAVQQTAVQQTDALPIGAYQEVVRFLLSQPAPVDILQFKVSETAQLRLRELLGHNNDGSLSEEEMAELDCYEQLDQLMQMLKIQAYASMSR